MQSHQRAREKPAQPQMAHVRVKGTTEMRDQVRLQKNIMALPAWIHRL
ncbi:hypothetical protein AB7M49_007742 [Bradyrhizobium elkanii]